jgi:hypothetical protein
MNKSNIISLPLGYGSRRRRGRVAWVQGHLSKVHDNWYQIASVPINGFRCQLIYVITGSSLPSSWAMPPSPAVAQYSDVGIATGEKENIMLGGNSREAIGGSDTIALIRGSATMLLIGQCRTYVSIGPRCRLKP